MAGNITTLPTISQPFANSGQRADIPNNATGTNRASMQEGWNSITSTPIDEGGVPANRSDFNGLGYLGTLPLLFIKQGGFVTYSLDESNALGGYPKGAILWVVDAQNRPLYMVRSLVANNTVNPNTTVDGVNWEKITINPNGDKMLGTLSDVQAAQLRNIQIVSEEPTTGVDGTIYAIIEQ